MLRQSHYKVGCDAHKHYSLFAIHDQAGNVIDHVRVNHERGSIQSFLSQLPERTPVALETVGNWYWIADEIEAAGCTPFLAHAAKAKVMMGQIDKTDKLDADGLATLLRLGTLPTVWLPPASVRDERELPRTRMALTKWRTAIKNRIHATLAKYALSLDTASDIFAPKWRPDLQDLIQQLPPETQRCVKQELMLLDELKAQILQLERRIRERIALTHDMRLLKTLPGVADILAIVIEREIGAVHRFPSAGHLASYSGTVPTVHASGGRVRYGRMRKACNQYLKWAFVEAANAVVRHRANPSWRHKHVAVLYTRIRRRKGHGRAIGAVARHLAEAAFWILKKSETYREPITRKHREGRGKRVAKLAH